MVQIPGASIEKVDIEATLKLILKNAVTALNGCAGVVAVWDEAENRYLSAASYGLSAEALAHLDPILIEVAPDLAGSRNSYDLLSDLRPDLELPASCDGVKQNPIIALPLNIGGKSIGLIYVLRALDSRAFSGIDQPVLAAFAEQAAIALQNARLAYHLEEEKKRIEFILENSADGILSIDARCRILGFNSSMEKLTGYLRDEVLGRKCSRLLCFSDPERKNLCAVRCPMQVISASDKPIFEQDGIIRTKDGREVHVLMVYSIVRTAEGKPLNAVINVRDMSKVKEMEDFREAILSMLGHELQTPLTIIKGYTSTLSRKDGKWDAETVRQGLQAVEEESDRLSQVMSKLLLASRLSTGALKLEKEPVQLPALARKVVRRISNHSRLHEFKIDFPADFPTVIVEPQMMEQVLTNLVENAVKYSPRGGKVLIFGEKITGGIRVTVDDEGIGISAGDIENLFQKFYRGKKGQSLKIQGTGLGLYICKSIIEAHGGKLEVSSRAGRGAEFSFTLPVEEEYAGQK